MHACVQCMQITMILHESSVLNSCIVHKYALNGLLCLYSVQPHAHKLNVLNLCMPEIYQRTQCYYACMFLHMHIFSARKLMALCVIVH